MNFKTATFGLGWFWGPDAQFGIVNGVIRTRVGYSGGSKENPTYHNLGDHTEVIQLDYDESKVSFEKLVNIFFNLHNPYYENQPAQYKSIIFYNDEYEKEVSIKVKTEFEEKRKHKLYTEIVKYDKFYMAENYHQKYYLQIVKEIYKDLRGKYDEFSHFVNSNEAAKINGYLKGNGTLKNLETEIDKFNISNKSKKRLVEIVESYGNYYWQSVLIW